MLDMRVDIQGDKVVLNGLGYLEKNLPKAAARGLSRIARGIHREAHENLSGAGAKASNIGAGGYPVPVRSGHLRSCLDWLQPGESKTMDGANFTADKDEAMVFNAAAYGMAIHEGTGSSAKFGPRRYITDAAAQFLSDGKAVAILGDEIDREIRKGGF
jgi:hypothetical protein